MIKLSYLITIHNETESLDSLLNVVSKYKDQNDEIIILDDFSNNQETLNILTKYNKFITNHIKHSLNNNYGEHKNYGTANCKGEYIFQIDGDEVPREELIINIKSIIDLNNEVELFYVPRINDYVGVTDYIAKNWGWELSVYKEIVHERVFDTESNNEIVFLKKRGAFISSKKTKDGKFKISHYSILVNYPDYQGRVYKNNLTKIKWDRRLHEKISGHKLYSFLPREYSLALYHKKPIEKQIETNIRYNKLFSIEENMGHVVI